MKTTYHTDGFLADENYRSGLPAFLEQYRERFPGLSYLHLELGEDAAAQGQELLHYYGDGRCLKIHVAGWKDKQQPSSFEVYAELRSIFDSAVEAHLELHQEEAARELARSFKKRL